MTESRLMGTCGSCQKTFQVPAAGKKYRCKSCGGVVTAPVESVEEEAELEASYAEELRCGTCGAVNEAASRFCDECGEALVEGARRSRSSRAAHSRSEASSGLKRARKVTGIVRMIFGFNAFVVGLLLLVTYQHLIESNLVRVGLVIWVALAILTGILALSVVGFIRARLEPFTWAILLACLSSLGRALELADGEVNLIKLAWTAALWCLVPATVSVRRILRENPDHYGVQNLQGTQGEARKRKRSKGRLSRGDAKDLARLSRRRLAIRTATALAIVVGGSGTLAGVVMASRPDGSDAACAAFVKEWNSGDLASLSHRFAGTSDTLSGRWQRLQEGPLGRSLPTLSEPTRADYKPTSGALTWDTASGEVALSMQFKGGNWRITGFQPPLPPLGDLPLSFRSTWNAGSLRGVASLYAESSQEKMVDYLGRMRESRNWKDDRDQFAPPQLSEGQMKSAGIESFRYVFDSEEGTFDATFRLREKGVWALASLKLPKR